MKLRPRSSVDWVLTQKISKKRTNKYVTIHIHDREVTWN